MKPRGHRSFVPSIVANLSSLQRGILEHAAAVSCPYRGKRTGWGGMASFSRALATEGKEAAIFHLNQARIKRGTGARSSDSKRFSSSELYTALTGPKSQFELSGGLK